jgi:hypothetical protein
VAYAAYEPGEGDGATERSGIYSLGLLTVFVLRGKHLFDRRIGIVRVARAMAAGASCWE